MSPDPDEPVDRARDAIPQARRRGWAGGRLPVEPRRRARRTVDPAGEPGPSEVDETAAHAEQARPW